ncbi:MAG: hypothetical protein JSV11_09680 [Nitrospiraceae bacterium]|nr:MAG: hypothetical protein JSV11_09680 [Nitrospiraceae bacterium]
MDRHNRNCLKDYEIGAYLEGRLSDIDKDKLEKRLYSCKECWEDFVMMKQAITYDTGEPEEEIPSYLIQRAINMYPEKTSLIDVIVGFLKDSLQVMHYSEGFNISMPLPVGGLRSGTVEQPNMVVIKKSFDDIEVELDIEKTGGDLCNIRVAVEEVRKKMPEKPLRVELVSHDRELVSNLLEKGETLLEDVGTGQYTIKIHTKGKVFGEIALKIE